MPELPEVETIRQDLCKKILNKKIVQVKVLKNSSVNGMKTKFVQALKGNVVADIQRRGKLMIWSLKRGEEFVLVHLKMTGQLIYIKNLPPPRPASKRATPPRSALSSRPKGRAGGDNIEVVAGGHKLSEADIECLPNQWTRVVFVFMDGSQLFFNDLRLFGYMKLATQSEVDRALKKYGPEPILTPPHPPLRKGRAIDPSLRRRGAGRSSEFTFSYFSSLFQKRAKTSVKALLLNQELIAGLGNIYVDEVCFCAGVKPIRRVGSVTKAEQRKLFSCIPKILNEAIKHRGTTFRNFLDSSGKKGNYTDFLKVYDRDGEPCKKCGAIIKKIRAAGRGTHYCAKCQH